ncbi:POLR protein, partial [Eurystomus gularis]|nr:POLR protein [Eurystomus gularis]
IMTERLTRACSINPRQRGFIRASGCSKNLKLLQLIVRHAKREHCELGVVFVDIAKAFDTVSHKHMVQRRVDPQIIQLVQEFYRNINTYIC